MGATSRRSVVVVVAADTPSVGPAAGLAELGRMADAGQLRVPVADVLPLEELPAAFALSREGQVRGKLVISVSD